ncbi:hypothetical protein E7T06_18440 [Deinococcus sp. Arct2-2]|uniref:hypothetical protein n=1 Tax=Deinococcus sp. Arct2-2 TaxID=2568653 RepID=UPI0010A4E398|nr:hypothetical protein [Deinococcus sp. Arct2-2]THF68018.1 hypothetical protein E7T06_18440 [Deinococcus sp. Arct2-2]
MTAYLRRATLGVPRQHRQELWDELEDHLLTRSRHLQAMGHPQDAALAQALAELGVPGRVSIGMGRVFRTGSFALGLGLLMATATLLALRPTPAPEVLSVQPPWAGVVRSLACSRGSTPCLAATLGDVWLQPDEVAAALRRPGVRASVARDGTLQIIWRGHPVTVPASPVTVHASLTSGAHPRIGAAALTAALLQVEPELRVRGYNRMPVLQGGLLTLTLSPAQGQMTSAAYYRGLGRVLLARMSPAAPAESTTGRSPLHRLTTALAPGEVVMLVTRTADGRVNFDVAPVGTGGRVRLRSAASHSVSVQLKLVTNISELGPATDNGLPALLVQLTNVPLGAVTPEILQANL